ncbi:fungal-specific transcription factor domain-containing protein [Lentinula raphanica]|nr:fungal-specific transcription factor domain-containing protein [Lentinula raphanica]KAJ3964959.1 fungal-specific transcription factor domain-containing protein [Lentinula raphanica]
MPQAPRKDPAIQRAQDKESKRARGALSCAECRRLKLKCDKIVPCSSCKRRGCSSICPNGVLITGQGTRFVLADTEKLHAKIEQMSDRIRSLEDALSILHASTGSQEPHPLLQRDLMNIKSGLDLHAAVQPDGNKVKEEELEDSQYIDAFGTLAIRDDGASTFYGRSAGSESLLIGESAAIPDSRQDIHITQPNGQTLSGQPTLREWQQQAAQARGLPEFISHLSQSFPLPTSQPIPNLEYLVDTFLPPWPEASRLCNLYLEQAPWFFGAVTERQLLEELLPMWYAEAPRPVVAPSLDASGTLVGGRSVDTPPIVRSGLGVGTMSSSSPLGTNPNPPADFPSNSSASSVPNGRSGSSHDLALLFMVFCFGALTDVNLPAAPENMQSEHYYDLTKVGLNLEGILDRPPSVSTVQALSLMGIYEGMRSAEHSIESTWALMGMATKLAQSIGLHRDCARWKLPPSEVQKRRALFWELFITDCWQSLATGRLATFSLPFVDCELPADPDGSISDDGTVQPSFPFWKARFGAECVSAVVQGTLTSRAPKYSIILDLDRKVRDMELPKYAQGPIPEGAGLKEAMSCCMPTNYRELTLLYIHRCFFTHAIQSNPGDPIKSQYAPSFLAGYRSACDLLKAVRNQFSMFPAQIARFWVLWTHAFSSAVMISSVVTHGSRSKVAPAALLELKNACDLFEQAAFHGGRAVKFLPIVQRLLEKAQRIFYNGVPPAIPNDIFRPSDTGSDEISVFSGKTHTVATKTRTPSVRSPGSNGSARSSQSPSGSPSQTFSTTNPSFAGVHPTLVQELNTFDGHINAQLHDAYRNNHAKFNEVLMGPRLNEKISYENEQQALRQYEQQQHQREMDERQHMEIEEEERFMRQQEEQRRATEEEAYAQSQRQHQHSHYSYSQSPTSESSIAHGVPMPAPVRDHPMQDQRRTLAHSQSHPNLHRVAEHTHYAEYSEESSMPSTNHYHHSSVHQVTHQQQLLQHRPPATQPAIHQSHRPHHPTGSGRSDPSNQPQHEMYAIPIEYINHHQITSPTSSDTPISPTSVPTSRHHHHSDSTVYEAHHEYHQQSRPQTQGGNYWPHERHSSAVDGAVYHDMQQPPHHNLHHSTYYHQGHQGHVPLHISNTHQHYTPEAAMQGMAAEDPRLQETWTSYMYKVGSPRAMFDE